MRNIINKIKSNSLFTFLIGAILFGGIGIYGTNAYKSNTIEYSPTDSSWGVNNVSDALNSLYDITTNATTIFTSIEFQSGNYLLIKVADFKRLSFVKNNSGTLNVYYLNESKQQLKAENWNNAQTYDIDLSGTTYLKLDYGYLPTFSNVKFE